VCEREGEGETERHMSSARRTHQKLAPGNPLVVS
jgi:hypothetical protein